MKNQANSWTWDLLHPNDEQARDVPCPRAAFGGMLDYKGRIYLFGGIKAMYGQPKGPGDLSVQGSMNDLWRYDPDLSHWTMLEETDERMEFATSDTRPCTRKLAAWLPIQDSFYLFGGTAVQPPGFPVSLGVRGSRLNDLWSYDPNAERWDLIELDDGRASTLSANGDRPAGSSGMGAAVLGDHMFLMGGLGATAHAQLWTYDTRAREWTYLGSSEDKQKNWPSKRYCPVMAGWNGKLYLWGGRDPEDQAQEFHNDLWEYDPAKGVWTCIEENRTDDPSRPSPRYGLAHTVIGHQMYMFGGFAGGESEWHPQLNDLWRYDLQANRWDCLYTHNGAKDYSHKADRPGVKRIPVMASSNGYAYLFGGLDLATGPTGMGPLAAYNDFWRGTPH